MLFYSRTYARSVGAGFEIPANRHPVELVAYLAIAASLMTLVHVRVNRGSLSLSAIAYGAIAIVLRPIEAAAAAAIVAVLISLSVRWRSRWLQVLGPAAWTLTGSWTHLVAIDGHLPHAVADPMAVAATLLANWLTTAAVVRAATAEPFRVIYRRNFTRSWYAAFLYMGLASLLIGNLLDGSLRGYVLSTIAVLLTLALTDSLSTRQTRAALESQLTDADRHLTFSRLVEGVVHNLRNHVWAVQGYLHEIDRSELPSAVRRDLDIAEAAATDAATSLRNLSTGAAPRVEWSADPIDLNDVVRHSMALSRNAAREKGVQMRLDGAAPDTALVRGDPLLLREVVTNLLTNAIEAAPTGGRIRVSTGARDLEQVYFTVADNGPGVPDSIRHHLFEPHFTTKPNGTGIGLFTSYGIIREHGGSLLYEGEKAGGAVFTALLPVYS